MILKYKNYTLQLNEISEADFINVFLQAEIKSKRFSEKILIALNELKSDLKIITKPDLTNSEENNLRKAVLEKTRKYTSRKDLFEGFPSNVSWYRTNVTPEFLLNEIQYIDYDYWTELSSNTRFPKNAVEKIIKNEKVFNVPYDSFLEASDVFKKKRSFEEIIIVTDLGKFVVLEGHLRLTVYAMNSDILPEKISLVVGISEDMTQWTCF